MYMGDTFKRPSFEGEAQEVLLILVDVLSLAARRAL